MFNPYIPAEDQNNPAAIMNYDLVSYGYIIVMYECGAILQSDCLKAPAFCQGCLAAVQHIQLIPSPHPEIPKLMEGHL